jgi:predicted nucleic-acid-binding protein
VKAIDTNLLVRLVARDDAEQVSEARAVIAAGDVLILPTVVLEAEWVLRSGLTTLMSLSGVTVVSAGAVAAALAAYAQAGDFADLLHCALAAEAGAISFVTFDRGFTRSDETGPELQIL